MSNEIEAIKDPGLPAHVHRRADTDPKAAQKAERQVAILFLLSALGTVTLIGSYIFIPQDVFIFFPVLGSIKLVQLSQMLQPESLQKLTDVIISNVS